MPIPKAVNWNEGTITISTDIKALCGPITSLHAGRNPVFDIYGTHFYVELMNAGSYWFQKTRGNNPTYIYMKSTTSDNYFDGSIHVNGGYADRAPSIYYPNAPQLPGLGLSIQNSKNNRLVLYKSVKYILTIQIDGYQEEEFIFFFDKNSNITYRTLTGTSYPFTPREIAELGSYQLQNGLWIAVQPSYGRFEVNISYQQDDYSYNNYSSITHSQLLTETHDFANNKTILSGERPIYNVPNSGGVTGTIRLTVEITQTFNDIEAIDKTLKRSSFSPSYGLFNFFGHEFIYPNLEEGGVYDIQLQSDTAGSPLWNRFIKEISMIPKIPIQISPGIP